MKEKVSRLRDTINSTICEKYDNFESTVEKAEQLRNDAKSSYDAVRSAVQESKGPDNFLFPEGELDENKTVARQLVTTKRMVVVLELLAQVHERFLDFDKHLHSGTILLAAKVLSI